MITSSPAVGRGHQYRVVGRRQHDRGLSESIQYAVLVPVLMLAVLGMIQVGVWVHGRDVAGEAARLAVDETRGTRPDVAAAQAAALRVTAVGGLRDVDVRIDRGPDEVLVTVSAAAPTFFDLGLARLQEQATAPVERVTRP